MPKLIALYDSSESMRYPVAIRLFIVVVLIGGCSQVAHAEVMDKMPPLRELMQMVPLWAVVCLVVTSFRPCLGLVTGLATPFVCPVVFCPLDDTWPYVWQEDRRYALAIMSALGLIAGAHVAGLVIYHVRQRRRAAAPTK